MRVRVLRIYAVIIPLAQSLCYFYFKNPVWMLTVSQVIGVITYPLIAAGTIYLRYKHLDQRIAPSKLVNFTLWLCFLIMLCLAAYIIYLVNVIRGAA